MTRQEIFEKVANHLLTQNKKSSNGQICLYRGPNNTKCSIGCLIPDYLYKEELEGSAVKNARFNKIFDIIEIDYIFNSSLLTDLQEIHDCKDVAEWRKELIGLGKEYNLDYSFIN